MNSYTFVNEQGELEHVNSCPNEVADAILQGIHEARLIPRHRLSEESFKLLRSLYPHASNSVLNRCSPIEHPVKHAINQFWTDYCMWASRLSGDRPCFVGVNPYYLTSHEIANNYLQGAEPYFATRDQRTKYGNKHFAKTEFKKLSDQDKDSLGNYSAFVFCFANPTEDVPENVPIFILNYVPQLFDEPQDTQDGHYVYRDGYMGFTALNGDVYVYDAAPTTRPYPMFSLGGGVGLYVNAPAMQLLYNLLSKDVYAPFIHRRGLHVAVSAKNRRYNLASAFMRPDNDFTSSWASLHGYQRIQVPKGYYRYDYFNFKIDGVLQCVRIAIAQYEWYVNHRETTNFPTNLQMGAVLMFCDQKNYPVIDTTKDGELPESFLALSNGHLVFMSNKPPVFDEDLMNIILKQAPTARGFEHYDMPEEKQTKALISYLAKRSTENAEGQERGALKGEATRDEFKVALTNYSSAFWLQFKSANQVGRAMRRLRFRADQIKKGTYVVRMLKQGCKFDASNNLLAETVPPKRKGGETSKAPPTDDSDSDSSGSNEEDSDDESADEEEKPMEQPKSSEEKKSGPAPGAGKNAKKDKRKKENKRRREQERKLAEREKEKIKEKDDNKSAPEHASADSSSTPATSEVSKNKTSETTAVSKEESTSATNQSASSGSSGSPLDVQSSAPATLYERVQLKREENKKLDDKEYNDELARWKTTLFGAINTVNVLNPVTMCSMTSTKGISYLILTPRKKTLAYYMDYLRYLLAKVREFITGAEAPHFRTSEFQLTTTGPSAGTVIVLPPVSATLITTYRKAGTEVGNNEMQAVLQYFDDVERQTCYTLIADFLGLPIQVRMCGRHDLCSTVQRLSSTLTQIFAWLRLELNTAAPKVRRSITPLISSMINTCSSMIANATGALRSLCEWAISAFRAWLSKHRSKSPTSSPEFNASYEGSRIHQQGLLPSSNTCTQPNEGDTSAYSPSCTGDKTPLDSSLNQNPFPRQTNCAPHALFTRLISGTTSFFQCALQSSKSCCSAVFHALKDVIRTRLPGYLKNLHFTLVLSLSQMCQNLIIVCHLPFDAPFWKRYMILLMSPNFFIRGVVEPSTLLEPSTTLAESSLVRDSLERLLCWPYALFKLLSKRNTQDIDTLIVETIMSDIYRRGTSIRMLSRVLSNSTSLLGWILGLRIPAQTLLGLCSYNVGTTTTDPLQLAWSGLLADSYLECSSRDSNPEPRSFIATFMRSAVVNSMGLRMCQSLAKSATILGFIAILSYVFGTDTWISVFMMIVLRLISWIYRMGFIWLSRELPTLTAECINVFSAGIQLINVQWWLGSQRRSLANASPETPSDSDQSTSVSEEYFESSTSEQEETDTPTSGTSEPMSQHSEASPVPNQDQPTINPIVTEPSGSVALSGFDYPLTTTLEGSERAYFIRMHRAPQVYLYDQQFIFDEDYELETSFESQFHIPVCIPYNPESGTYELCLVGETMYLIPSLVGDISLEVYVGYWPHKRQPPRNYFRYINFKIMPHANFKAALEREQKISSGLNAIVGDLSEEGKRFVYCHCDAGEHADITPAGIPDQNCMPSVTIWSRFETTTFDSSFFGQTPTSYTILITPFANYPVVVCGEFLVGGQSVTRYIGIEDPTITTEFMVSNTIKEFRRIGAAGTMVYTSNVLNQNGTIICNQFPSGNDDFSMPTNLPIKPDTVSRATPQYVRLNIRDGFYMPIKYYEPVYEFINCSGNTATLTINGSTVYSYATRLNSNPTAIKVLPNTRYCWGVAALSGLAEGASFSLKVSHGYQMLISGPCSLSSLVHPAPFYDVRALQMASLLAGWMAMAYPSRYNDWAAVKRWLAGAMENKTVQSISKTLVNAIPVVGSALSNQVDSLMDQAAKSLRGSIQQPQSGNGGKRTRSKSAARSRSVSRAKEGNKGAAKSS